MVITKVSRQGPRPGTPFFSTGQRTFLHWMEGYAEVLSGQIGVQGLGMRKQQLKSASCGVATGQPPSASEPTTRARAAASASGRTWRGQISNLEPGLTACLVSALRRREHEDADALRASALLADIESRLLGAAAAGRFHARLQDAVLRHGVFAAVEQRLVHPADRALSDGCAAAVLALVRFNRGHVRGANADGSRHGALVASASSCPSSTTPLHALNGLVDELHGRAELPRLVVLLCAAGQAIPRG